MKQECQKYTPYQLMQVAKKIYSGNRRLTLQNKITSIYRPLYAPFDVIFDWISPQARVVDIGCGTGALLLTLQSLKGLGQCHGFDTNKKCIEIAASVNKFKNISFVLEEKVPTDIIQKADVVLMIDLLHHISISEKYSLLKSIFRNSRRDAVIIIKELDPKPYWRALANRLTDYLSTRSKVQYIGMGKILTIMKDCGFEVKLAQRAHKHIWSHYITIGKKITENVN